MKRVQIISAARAEMRAAVRWYESRRRGLGFEFVTIVDEDLKRIAALPEAAPLWRSNRPYRMWTVRRFPYAIFYEIRDEIVMVLAIAHQRRRPGYWIDQ